MSDILLLDRMVLNAADYREDYLDDGLHLVVPAVAIAEGAWKGSEGDVFYHRDDLKAADSSWNHKPIVLNHPKKKGKAVSAADPEILNKSKVGLMLNTSTGADGKQRYEAWINVAKADKVDARLVTNIRNKQKVETSTGLFAQLKEEEGEWNGRPYKFRAVDHKPDHMAVLLDESGAYSVADGGGLLANSSGLPDDIKTLLSNTVSAWLTQRGVLTNGSLENTKAQLYRKLAATYGEPGKDWYGYVEAMFDSEAVFSTGGPDYKCMKVGYKATKDGVELVGDAVPVKSVQGYRSPDGSVLMVNGSGDLTEDTSMDLKAHIATLIGNGYEEADRPFLEGLKEGVLKIKPVAKAVEEKKETPVLTVVNTNPTPTGATKPQTVEQYLQNAPPEIALLLNEAVKEKQVKKDRLVGNILANPNNRFTEEWLKSQPYPVLEGMAAFAGTQQQAQGDQLDQSSGQYILQNAGQSNRNKAEELPTLDTSGLDDLYAPAKK